MLSPMSFKRYVAAQPVTESARGDFLRDAKVDHALPDAKSWAELEDYLIHAGASTDAVACAKLVWSDYKASNG